MKKLQVGNFTRNQVEFEQWLDNRIRKSKVSGLERQQAAYQIPVVVHVIHNGEAIGSGRNISAAQILSQISVLNNDFQRLNTDAVNTPAEFQSVAGSLSVEFVLAKQDPEGLATTGIRRVQGTQTSWTVNDNYELKSLSYWPAEDYLNIWVCNLTDLLGYAQFPISGLSGLENSSDNRLTDGVVIAYNAFGSEDEGPFNLVAKYRKGRSTTHEIGHFLGLRHTWGDDEGQCSGSDYVSDTPNQAGSSSGCPSHPQVTCTNVVSMSQNFLDYTDDACMNLFTIGQVGRMTTVLQNSPRRKSLLTSHGLSNPLPVSNDLGIKEVISPLAGECNSLITPVIELRNYGNNDVSSARVSLRREGTLVETKDFTLNLSSLQSSTVSFSPTSIASGAHSLTFEIILTNSVTDGNPANNTVQQSLTIPETIAVPFVENFNSIPPSWQITNPDLKTTWKLVTAPNETPTNQALKMDFYNYEDNLGEVDLLITPLFDLTNETVALLLFDVAYARFQSDNDGLKVVMLSNCNSDINQGTVLYDEAGASLSTSPSTTSEFIPSNNTQWRSEFIDLSSFAGQSNLQLAFVGINDWGNNLYLDNISLVTTPLNDLALKEVISPGPVTCLNEVTPKLRIQNVGTLASSFKIRTSVNGQTSTIQTFSGLNFKGGSSLEITLNSITLVEGNNTIEFELTEPNGLPDIHKTDNIVTTSMVVSSATDEIPLRINFEEDLDEPWTNINLTGGMNWQEVALDSTNALYFNAYENEVIGDKGWFVSPILDFSKATAPSVSFDLSYAFRAEIIDQLLVLASTDCGLNYGDTLLNEVRSTLSNGRSQNTAWIPTSSDSSAWKKRTVDLKSLIGETQIRIAFVFISGNGNNIYLDNIEFFVSEPPPENIGGVISIYPVPAKLSNDDVRISFNLKEKESVEIEVIDPTGKILTSQRWENVLNQTLPLFTSYATAGVYIVRVKTKTGVYTKRAVIVK